MSDSMRAVAAEQIGSTQHLRVTQAPVPQAGSGEVRVRVVCSAVNPADFKVITGASGAGFIHAKTVPLFLGYDVSGTVDAVGEGVDTLQENDDVFGHLAYASSQRQGAFAEFVTLPADAVAKKPASVSHEAAAASATAGLTALQALRDVAQVHGGDRVLVIGAAGGVGSLAVAIAKRLDLQVTAVCSTPSVDFVRELGADDVIDRSKEDFLARAADYHAIFDTPAVSSFARCARRLVKGGAYVTTLPSLGFVTGKLRSLFAGKRCSLIVVASKASDLDQLAGWIADGMPVPIESRHPVKDVAHAIEAIGGGGRSGRIVVNVKDGW